MTTGRINQLAIGYTKGKNRTESNMKEGYAEARKESRGF